MEGVALVIIARVGDICKDVLGRFDIMILVVVMLQRVSFAKIFSVRGVVVVVMLL